MHLFSVFWTQQIFHIGNLKCQIAAHSGVIVPFKEPIRKFRYMGAIERNFDLIIRFTYFFITMFH